MAKKKADAKVEPQAADTGGVIDEAASHYTVLARRYRPQQFSDLVGQEPVAQALTNAIQSGRVAHAYLFTGARGVGKTSTARILAKAINCEKGPTATPCDQCEMCKAITSGEDIDVLEIDGASNRGIDEIREIRQNVQFRPSRARYKIYIIDEVHMLTGQAFNALLKTLEEPPPHVKFIFATTEVQKIPITILSRCQRFDFAGIGMVGLVDRLKAIVASEKMQADDEALELIARRAGGSMRDAQSLLDQLLAFGSERLTAEQIHHLLGTANEERIVALATAVLEKNPKSALETLGEAVDQGVQVTELLDQLIEYWRDLMVVHAAGMEKQSVSVTGAAREQLKQQAKATTLDSIMSGLDVLVSARNRMRFSGHGRALFEMALVRLSRLDDLVALSQLAEALASGQELVKSAAPAQGKAPAQVAAVAPALAPEKKKVTEDKGTPGQPRLLTTENLSGIWEQLLSEVGFMLGAELRKAGDVAISGPNCLVIRFLNRYNGPGDTYLDSARIAKVEEILTRIVGQPCTLRVETAAGAQPPLATTAAAESTVSRSRRVRGEAVRFPLVAKAMETLGTQVIHMDDDFGTDTESAPTQTDNPSEEEA